MRHLLLIAACALTAAGCAAGAAKLDASSDEALKASLERMTAGMSAEQKQEFMTDCMTVAMPDAMKNMFDMAAKGQNAQNVTGASIFKSIDGLTVAQIRAKAEEVRAAQKK